MSNIYIESKNFIEDATSIPDRLRSELGQYYSRDPLGAVVPTRFESNRLLSSSVSPGERNDQLLFPTYNHFINVYGRESEFRDQQQWAEFVEQICITGQVYENHSFILDSYDNSSNVVYEYHDFTYEDLSKEYDTNLLLNYNLMNYRFNNESSTIQNMSLIKSIYDPPNIEAPNSEDTFRLQLLEYPLRIQDYAGSIVELDRKQRNIFDFRWFSELRNKHGVSKEVMPFYYDLTVTPNTTVDSFLHSYLEESGMSKFVMQAIKNNTLFRFFDYEDPSGEQVSPNQIKSHDLTNILINYNFSNFVEGDDELFLHQQESQINSNDPSNRFVNIVGRIRFLENYRNLLKLQSQDYHDVINCMPSILSSVGWKIEKYYLTDQTVPVQTYYISKHGSLNEFVDTQLKYGDTYIYKVFHLVAVVGSYYSYSDIHTSAEGVNEGLVSQDGVVSSFGDHDNAKKYGARMKVSVSPSFQVLEIPAFDQTIALNDRPTLPPEVVFYNESNKKNNIMILLKTPDGEIYDSNYHFQRIGPNDEQIENNLMLSRDNLYGTVFSNEHFTGVYEIYRMDTPPTSISDFENNFLVLVDQQADILSKQMDSLGTRYNYTLEYPNASYEDVILPHKKYYYLFRSSTYHGTPSNPSHIYELELLEDSDETRISVKEYKIPEQKEHSYTKTCKRLMRIVPNMEQLLFNNEFTAFDNSVLGDIGILPTKIFNGMPTGKVFKIRITSKHTGKKMDINLRFKIKKSNF